MKIFLLTVALACSFFTGHTSNYYFSSSVGDDNRSSLLAQNPATPWRSLQKLNAIFSSLLPGDTVFFKRGDVFDGKITATASGTALQPIVFGAFGAGEKPVINGFQSLGALRSEGGKFWSAAWDGAAPNILLLNGQQQPLGRFPNRTDANGGYLTFETHSGTASITDNELGAAINWTGAEMVIRKNRWIIDRCPVTAQNGRTVSYTNSSQYEPVNGYGYFFQNHLQALDVHGEWAYVKGQKRVYAYLDQYSTSTTSVGVSAVDELFTISNRNYIVIRDLAFRGANENAMAISNARSVTVSQCSFSFTAANSLLLANATDVAVENNSFVHSNNNAITANKNCRNVRISGNTISKTGVFPGMGKSGDLTYQAITATGHNTAIEYNRIDSTGYIPIRFESDSARIRFNVITDFLFVKDDGGGIYTWNNGPNAPENFGRVVSHNILANGIGVSDGTNDPGRLHAQGIYLDDNVANVEITGNSIFNCAENGIYLRNARRVTIRDNTAFNNGTQLYLQHDRVSVNNPIRQVAVRNNIFVAKQPSQLLLNMKSIRDDIAAFGKLDSNFYSRPLNNKPYILTAYEKNDQEYFQAYDLSSWRQVMLQDSGSKPAPFQVKPYERGGSNGTNKIGNGGFEKTIQDVSGFAVSGSYQLQWNERGRLDGGALEVVFDSSRSNRAYVIMNVGSLVAGRPYLLRFSVVGSRSLKSLSVFLRKAGTPFTPVTDAAFCKVHNYRTENEFLLVPTASEASATLVFDINEQARLWLDNVSLSEANLTLTNPDNLFFTAQNTTNATRSFALDAEYVDAKGVIFSGSLTLPPFSSAVLMKKSFFEQNQQAIELQGSQQGDGILLNWQTASAFNGNFFRVERSEDGFNYTTIDTRPIDQSSLTTYSLLDPTPLKSKAFYRVRQVQQDNTSFTSAVINFASASLAAISIYPNPVRSHLTVYFKEPALYKNETLLLFNALGQQVGRYDLSAGNYLLQLNTSHLQQGLYYLKAGNEKYSFIKVL